MKKIIICCILCCAIPFLFAQELLAQGLSGYSFKVVNMIPNVNSNETNFDSETNIAVNPANVNTIVGSAFTRNTTGSTTSAPIFISTDNGSTWALNNIVPSGNGMTADISVGFGTSSNTLYTGILRGGSGLRKLILRTSTPGGAGLMTTLVDRNNIDQPFVTAMTANDAGGIARDRVYIGDNNLGVATGRTAEVELSNNAATGAAPAGFADRIIEARATAAQDFPAIRLAAHNSGIIYAVFYRWQSGSVPSARCDVVVVRDDNFGTGATPFRNLLDAGDGIAGQRVVTNRTIPGFPASLGNNRLVGSNLSIAVDPNNSGTVYVAWCDRVSTSDYTLHVSRSTNSGQTWSADLLTITDATNPALAIANNGRIGLVYQRFTGGAAANWETHFRTATGTAATWSDDILSIFANADLAASTISPSLGDYLDMEAVGNTFYGVFPASNRADNANFPKGVTYQRNANFTTKTLKSNDAITNVNVSVDPFFFKIRPNPIIVDYCRLYPKRCYLWKIERDWLIIPSFVEISVNRIPLPEICKYVINCPGCEGNALCPPYFYIFLDEFNPEGWNVEIIDKEGEPIRYTTHKTKKGVVLSFRPSKIAYQKNKLENYELAVYKEKGRMAEDLKIKIRMEAGNYQYKDFLRYGRK